MKRSTPARAVAVLAAASLTALAAAAPAMTGGSSAATSTSASTQTSPSTADRDAKSVLNDRLTKCKAMRGDEKRACQKDARADAAAARGSAHSAQGTTKTH